MLNRNKLVCLALVAISLQLVSTIDSIETNDANKNESKLELSKLLEGVLYVGEAYMKDFKFTAVEDIRKFLERCEYVNYVMPDLDDSAFNGLAEKVREIMADPSINEACSVTSDELTEEFNELDTGLSAAKSDYLSANALNRLVRLKELADANERLGSVVHELLTHRIRELADALLRSASVDVDFYIGERAAKKDMFDLGITYKRVCDTSLIEPICKLVQSSPHKVSVVAKDIDDFAEMIRSQDTSELEQHVEASGVSMDVLRENCAKMMSRKIHVFKPIEMIRSYVAAGFLDSHQVEEHMRTDIELASYNSLFDLCNLVQ